MTVGSTAEYPMHLIRWSWRALRRDLRAGELPLVLGALVVAVAAYTTVSFTIDRIRRALESQAAELLAADLVLVSSEAIPEPVAAKARDLGLETATTLSFRSAVLAGDRLQLAELKAVDPAYPLRGRLQVADALFEEGSATTGIPARGEAWLEGRLLQLLNLDIGGYLHIGSLEFTAAKVLTYEPDRGGDLFHIAPRVMINLADIPATGLLKPGSRVRWRLLLKGEATQVQSFRDWLERADYPGLRLQDVREGRPELRIALKRAEQFLGLAALTSVALAGLAIALAARRHAARHLDHCALLRCFGARGRFILCTYTLKLLWLGLAGGLAGGTFGYLAQGGLELLLRDLFSVPLPPPTLMPIAAGLAVAVLALLGFGLPQIERLRRTPPARVLRRDLGPVPPSGLSVYGAALLALTSLLPWQSGDLELSLYAVLGLLCTALALTGGGYALIWGLNRLRSRVGVSWRFGLASLARRAGGSMAQILGIGLGITVMLLLTLLRADLLGNWRARLPADAPNYFLINVQPDEVTAVTDFLRREAGVTATLYPMVRGRLTGINDTPIKPEAYADDRAQRLASREFNLSWAERMPPDNRLVAGSWWPAGSVQQGTDEALFSVERGIAETLGIRLGDLLTYQIAGQTLRGRVANLRFVEWDSFNVNFFVVANPGVLENYPATYITSFHLPAARRAALNRLVRTHPSVTVIDVDALLSQVRRIMDQVARTIEYVFGFTLLAGLIVLYAALSTTHDERRHECALLAALGARRRQIFAQLAAEFGCLGLVAGFMSGFTASLCAFLLCERVLQIDFTVNPWVFVAGMLAGLGIVLTAGLLGTARIAAQPPLSALR